MLIGLGVGARKGVGKSEEGESSYVPRNRDEMERLWSNARIKTFHVSLSALGVCHVLIAVYLLCVLCATLFLTHDGCESSLSMSSKD